MLPGLPRQVNSTLRRFILGGVRRRVPPIGGALFFGVSGFGLIAGAFAWLALYPALPRDLGGAEDLDGRSRRARIAVAPGDSLDAWYLPPRNGAVILLLHGYGRTHSRMWRYGGFLSRAGYGVLAFDFRSSRARHRKPTTLGAYELPDAEAALAWLLREDPGAHVGILGESLGGSVGLVVASRHREVAAVLADGPFASGRLAIEESCERWLRVPRWPAAPLVRWMGRAASGLDPMALDVRPAAASLMDRPLFFIACERDDRISPGQIEELWRAAGAKDPLWRIAGAGHNQGWLRERGRYEERVLAFFCRHLPGAPSPPA